MALYSLEASGTIKKEVQEVMERVQRRFARMIIGAKKCVANETLLLDLDLPTIEAQTDLRTLRFRRTLEESQSNFMINILRVNISCNTNWNIRCEKLRRKYNIKKGDDQDLEETVRELDIPRKLRRLEEVVHRTTERYRRLNKFENNRH